MEPKPLLFPFLYDVQEATDLSESTSIYEAPILRERVKVAEESADATVKSEDAGVVQEALVHHNVRSIALKNRKLIQGIVLRNEFAKLLVETEDGPLWIAKSQIVQIYD